MALVTSSQTEILRLLVPVPENISSDDLRSGGLSLGYSLKAGMEHLYMLDGAEIIFQYGATFHYGSNLRRDRFIRNRLRQGNMGWQIVELTASDLTKSQELVERLKILARDP